MAGEYDDIIDMPYTGLRFYPRTPLSARGVIMSAFDALSGLDREMQEVARLTDDEVWLDEDKKKTLDHAFSILQAFPERVATISYFVADSLKPGGLFRTATGTITKFDDLSAHITLSSGEVIPLRSIVDISFSQDD